MRVQRRNFGVFTDRDAEMLPRRSHLSGTLCRDKTGVASRRSRRRNTNLWQKKKKMFLLRVQFTQVHRRTRGVRVLGYAAGKVSTWCTSEIGIFQRKKKNE